MPDTTPLLVVGAVVVLVIVAVVVFARRKRHRGELVPVSATPSGLGSSLRRALGRGLDEPAWVAIEEALLGADLGVDATARIVGSVRSGVPKTAEEARPLLFDAIRNEFGDRDRNLNLWGEPSVVMVVGVNGSGKTTTVARLANRLVGQGRTVLLAAADTFRAAGGDQVEVWGQRIGVPVVSGQEGGDPAAVVYDALASARAKAVDVVIVDTAGRLHSNKNLMEELAKVHRVAGGAEGVGEVLLVLDATAGQNGLAQAKEFAGAVPVSGVVLAKLDGTAKGGIVVAVEAALGVPVKLVGVGEGVDDIEPFDPDSFVAGLLA